MGCDVPYFQDPYAPKSGALRGVDQTSGVIVILVVGVLSLLMV